MEILSAALQSGIFLKDLDGKDENGNLRPYHLGHFFIAIDTDAFMGAEAFKKTAGNILRNLRNSQKAPGQERIYTAGEKEHDVWMYRKDKGVPVTEAVQKEFIQLRDCLLYTSHSGKSQCTYRKGCTPCICSGKNAKDSFGGINGISIEHHNRSQGKCEQKQDSCGKDITSLAFQVSCCNC